MAIIDMLSDPPRIRLHTGSITDFFSDSTDRERFTFIQRFHHVVEAEFDYNANKVSEAITLAEWVFAQQAARRGATHAFNVNTTILAREHSANKYIITGDIYKQELK